MKKTLVVTGLAVSAVVAGPQAVETQSIAEVAGSDVKRSSPGFVVGLIQTGTISFLEPFGTAGLETEEALSADQLFSFPALTELLVSATVQALADAELLNRDAPISTYFPLISKRMGTITLNQLLTHSSGLDDARVQSRFTWTQVMDQLNDAVLFTDPGVIHSKSRYSFPLAIRAVEKAVGSPFSELVELAILGPLEMTRSTFDLEKAEQLGLAKGIEYDSADGGGYREILPSTEANGLPVLFTTVEDVLHFLASWMGGGIRGTPPWEEGWERSTDGLPGERGTRGGVRVERVAGHLRASREGSALGSNATVHLFPEANTALVGLGMGYSPSRTIRLALDRVTAGLGPGSGTSGEALADSLRPTVVPKHEGGWTGRFLNGDRKVQLSLDGPGLVYHTATELVDVSPGTGGYMILTRRPTGRVGVKFQLVLDRSGRRYAILDGKAFIHEDDARVYSHGTL